MPPLPLPNTRCYDVVALPVTHWFNKYGDHDHNGMMFALKENETKISEFLSHAQQAHDDAEKIKHAYYHLMRPLVLRACKGETVIIRLKNKISNRKVGMHLQSDGFDLGSDGSHVGQNASSLVNYNGTITYKWKCEHEGTFVFHDAGNLSGEEDGTNLHGLFGALIIEPEETKWRDPITGAYAGTRRSLAIRPTGWYGDGTCVDIVPEETVSTPEAKKTAWLSPPVKYPEKITPGQNRRSFREFVIFLHDQVEYVPSHSSHTKDICEGVADICGMVHHMDHMSHPIMPISYRAEPMMARQKELWKMHAAGLLKAPVVHEEQHHSSWMFGDPVTPIFKSYIGDPIRIRLIDAGVKETHVFHLHLYSWHHDPRNKNSPILDAISISPLTAHTIEPLWGSGNRQGAVGDIVWHCHLYPHFHEGMWGLFRTFDRLQDGNNKYPDNTMIENLLPLPDRQAPPTYAIGGPGFPQFIEAKFPQRSPVVPWTDSNIPAGMDYRIPSAKEISRMNGHAAGTSLADTSHINTNPIPGWQFNAFKLPDTGDVLKETREDEGIVKARRTDIVPVAVETWRYKYNEHNWHDPEGHAYREDAPKILSASAPQNTIPGNLNGRHEFVHIDGGGHHNMGAGMVAHGYVDKQEPFFIRANHGDVVTLELENRLPRQFCSTPFDMALPPCDAYTVPVVQNDGVHNNENYWQADKTPPMQCGLHVHLVKFDPLVCDGASSGWNYLSGPRAPFYDEGTGQWRYLRMRYVWWVDEEFGVIFTHDHLFANFRQKRGLFGAMIAEPYGSKYLNPKKLTNDNRNGAEKVIVYKDKDGVTRQFREFCIALGDFVPLYNGHNEPLNPPPVPGHHSDHGVVGINYHSAPIRERWFGPHATPHDLPAGADPKRLDPAYVFSSQVWNDPHTPVFKTNANDPIRLRIVQGSHEEQHSFQVHGMRWKRFSKDQSSPYRNQQTIGISEAFTFKIEHKYGKGDYLYKFSSADDLWMGAWGIIRADDSMRALSAAQNSLLSLPGIRALSAVRRINIVAEQQSIQYSGDLHLKDPKGLVYRLVSETTSLGQPRMNHPIFLEGTVKEPLIIRCRKGEWVQITLTNKLHGHLAIEPAAPMVPVELLARRVSDRVSIHADLVNYNIQKSDGANVGNNPADQTVGIDGSIIYSWYADVEGPVLLQDMTCFRNHRHHGLIGALIVEPEKSSVSFPSPQQSAHAIVKQGVKKNHELVLLIQDGLRLFHFGNLGLPMGDPPGDPGEAGPDPTDQGQKAFNYKAHPVGEPDWLAIANPSTPVIHLPAGAELKIHLIGACDKPRNHSFTLHGHTWKEWPSTGSITRVGSATSISGGYAETIHVKLSDKPGDYAFHSGALAWAISQGLWGILRLT